MLGRGLLYNPEIIKQFVIYEDECNEIKTHDSIDATEKLSQDKACDFKNFWNFHDEIYHGYQEIMAPDKNVLFHMKELWTYWKELYTDCDREIRNILKTKNYGEYEAAIRQLK